MCFDFVLVSSVNFVLYYNHNCHYYLIGFSSATLSYHWLSLLFDRFQFCHSVLPLVVNIIWSVSVLPLSLTTGCHYHLIGFSSATLSYHWLSLSFDRFQFCHSVLSLVVIIIWTVSVLPLCLTTGSRADPQTTKARLGIVCEEALTSPQHQLMAGFWRQKGSTAGSWGSAESASSVAHLAR